MVFQNPDEEAIRSLLQHVKTIAVVGLSPKPDRPSFSVSRAMQRLGYRIVPVHPAASEVLGEKAYARLSDIPFSIDMVNVFREASALPGVVEEAIAIGAPAIWIQEGIVHEEAAEQARTAGLTVVMDRCIWKDHMRWMP